MRLNYRAMQRDFNSDPTRAGQELSEEINAGRITPTDISIRGLAEALIPDGREFVSLCNPTNSSSVLEAAGMVDTAQFSNITGQVIYSRMLQAYQSEDFVFTNLVETVPTVFSGERIPGIGQIGDQAVVVGEGESYPVVGLSEDYIDTPPTVKRGTIIPLTKEAIFFDRTGLVMSRAQEVGMFLGVNKEKRIIDCIMDDRGTATTYPYRIKWRGTTYATYVASGGHGTINKKASNTLIDWTSLDAAFLTQSVIVDPTTSEPIVSVGNDLIVCRQLVATANRINSATAVRLSTGGYAVTGNLTSAESPNPIFGIPGYSPPSLNIRTSALLSARTTTKTDWLIGDIAASFAYYENWPITVVQAPPNSDDEFDRDIVFKFKASERGTPVTKDFRRMILNTVA